MSWKGPPMAATARMGELVCPVTSITVVKQSTSPATNAPRTSSARVVLIAIPNPHKHEAMPAATIS